MYCTVGPVEGARPIAVRQATVIFITVLTKPCQGLLNLHFNFLLNSWAYRRFLEEQSTPEALFCGDDYQIS